MIIQQLWIKNFGKIQDKKIDLSEGINIIYGENESGKSTLHTFIRGIFFGIRRMRGRAAGHDVYSRYEPWDNEYYYAGVIRFISGGKIFRLERNFQKENQKEELICETDGERLSVKDGDLGMLLGNVSEAVYENTVSIGQLQSQTNEKLTEKLRNYMSNYQSEENGSTDLVKAIHTLREKKKSFEQQRKEEIRQREQLKVEFESRMQFVKDEIMQNQEKIREVNQKLEKWDTKEKQKSKTMGYAAIIPIIFMTAGVVLLPGMFLKSICVMGVLILGSLWLLWRIKEIKKKRQKMLWTRDHLENENKEKKLLLGNLKEEYREFQLQDERNTPVQEEIESIQLAMDTIEELSRQKQSSAGVQMKRKISSILQEMTGGKYTQLSIDNDFHPGLITEERYVPLERLSRGTIEQIYFALRMAAGDILCTEEPLPVILDEVFAMYDEERLKRTLKWLAVNKEQVILLSCQKREKKLLEEMKIKFHLVKL